MQPSFLTQNGRRLAYCKQEGASPTVVFLSGFKSDMSGAKAEKLAEFCAERKQAYLRLDYSGHGLSEKKFEEGTIGQWKEDALAVIDHATQGPLVLVGSSMGGWMALMIAQERKERMHALVGIAAAPDFTERLIWNALTPEEQKNLMETGVYHAPSCYDNDPYPITRQLIEEARNHLLLDKKLDITCPAHLIHGTNDQDVPVEIARLLQKKIPQATLSLVEGGDHRLSTPADLSLLCHIVSGMSKEKLSKGIA